MPLLDRADPGSAPLIGRAFGLESAEEPAPTASAPNTSAARAAKASAAPSGTERSRSSRLKVSRSGASRPHSIQEARRTRWQWPDTLAWGSRPGLRPAALARPTAVQSPERPLRDRAPRHRTSETSGSTHQGGAAQAARSCRKLEPAGSGSSSQPGSCPSASTKSGRSASRCREASVLVVTTRPELPEADASRSRPGTGGHRHHWARPVPGTCLQGGARGHARPMQHTTVGIAADGPERRGTAQTADRVASSSFMARIPSPPKSWTELTPSFAARWHFVATRRPRATARWSRPMGPSPWSR